MVELKMEALDFSGDNDTYIAVRVGESQKLCRLNAVRNFKFPKNVVGDRKFGKVDVFKKVGSATIGIRPDALSDLRSQDVEVPVSVGGRCTLRVTLGGEPSPPSPADKIGKQKLSSEHMEQAKNYLAEHNLEMLLADVVQEVLRDRPSDPAQFISTRVAQNGSSYRKGASNRAQTAPAVDSRSKIDSQIPDKDHLRLQAKQTLLEASTSGKLDEALSKVKVSTSPGASEIDIDKLRLQAKQKLCEATADGALNETLAKLKASKSSEPDDTESLRLEAKQTLMAATANGDLDAALSKVKQGDSKGSGMDAEFLRQQAKRTLLESTTNGQLDAALSKVKQGTANAGADALREQARQTLVQAATSGQLDAAWAHVKNSQEDSDTEALRLEAKQTLMEATANGKLDESLAKVKGSKEVTDADGEMLRLQAKQKLIEATKNGKLDESLAQVKGADGSGSDPDALRQQAKQILLQATQDGKLDNAFTKLTNNKSADSGARQVDELRDQAKQTLLAACASGKLDESLASLKGAFRIGDAVEVRDNDHCKEFKSAVVMSVQPLLVKVDGWSWSTSWEEVRRKV